MWQCDSAWSVSAQAQRTEENLECVVVLIPDFWSIYFIRIIVLFASQISIAQYRTHKFYLKIDQCHMNLLDSICSFNPVLLHNEAVR